LISPGDIDTHEEKPEIYMMSSMFRAKYMTGRWFSQGTLVSSTNKIDCHDIAEILLKVALNTIILILNIFCAKHTTHHINLAMAQKKEQVVVIPTFI
jgi:hypothetical protein